MCTFFLAGLTILELLRWEINKSSPIKTSVEQRVIITSGSESVIQYSTLLHLASIMFHTWVAIYASPSSIGRAGC